MVLRRRVGNVERPDGDPGAVRSFVIVAAVILQEWGRQGRLPDRVTRTYW
ncbi:hypothetical protein AB0F77_00820 [Streptomyces sp. NPDC026672]